MTHRNLIDLTGKKFGRLKVISILKERGNKNQIKWKCVCDCGNNHIVTGESLRAGKTKSCGCLKKEMKAHNYNNDRVDAILRIQYFHLGRRHNKKFKTKIISFNRFKELSFKKCKYCGLISSKIIEDRYCDMKSKKKISDTNISINGIDRVNSSLGYTKNNTVACCLYCNRAKMDMERNDFLEFIKRAYKYNFK